MKTLSTLVAGLSLLAFVASPPVYGDEHPGEHPGTEASGAAAPTTGAETTAAPMIEEKAVQTETTTKSAKKARKAKKQKKAKDTDAETGTN